MERYSCLEMCKSLWIASDISKSFCFLFMREHVLLHRTCALSVHHPESLFKFNSPIQKFW